LDSISSADKKTLWAVCWVTFLWSVASLMVFSLLPTFLTDELKVSKTTLGFIEGVAIFTAFLAKVFSGVFSDLFKTRRSLILIGTLGTAAVKPLFALSSGVWSIFWARTLDRLSKGVRSAPSDALIADISPKSSQGASYGMRYTLETAGFVVGGALASGLFALTQNYRVVFWFSILPGIFALIVLYRFVHDNKAIKKQVTWHWAEVRNLPKRYWQILGGIFILMQARFSEAFLNLRAKDYDWSVALIPLLFVAYNIVCANTAWPMGRFADKTSKLRVLLLGLLVLILANCIMIMAPNKYWIILGFMLCGLHMGMTHGVLAALIAENTLSHLRGTAFAMYYLTTGVAVLLGNTIAGFLAEHFQSGAFYGGLIFTSLAGLYFYKLSKEHA
jgi:MFS family permease